MLGIDTTDDEGVPLRIRRGLETQTERAIRQAMDNYLTTLFPPGTPDDEIAQIASQITTPQELRDALQRGLIRASDLGVTVVFDQLQNVGMAFDFTLVNTQARDWASRYTGELIQQIDETTRQAVREAVARWVENGEPLDALIADLRSGPFSARRASLIASTETTRAYAEANEIAYRESGVVSQVEWRAAVDERVCPVCGGLHGTRAPLGGTFAGGYRNPPAHPGCRCWTAPVIS